MGRADIVNLFRTLTKSGPTLNSKEYEMLKRLCASVKKVLKVMWCHRVVYAGAALAYGGMCVGVLDKEIANQVLTACYLALVVQCH
jgi:hypothetical protein